MKILKLQSVVVTLILLFTGCHEDRPIKKELSERTSDLLVELSEAQDSLKPILSHVLAELIANKAQGYCYNVLAPAFKEKISADQFNSRWLSDPILTESEKSLGQSASLKIGGVKLFQKQKLDDGEVIESAEISILVIRELNGSVVDKRQAQLFFAKKTSTTWLICGITGKLPPSNLLQQVGIQMLMK